MHKIFKCINRNNIQNLLKIGILFKKLWMDSENALQPKLTSIPFLQIFLKYTFYIHITKKKWLQFLN